MASKPVQRAGRAESPKPTKTEPAKVGDGKKDEKKEERGWIAKLAIVRVSASPFFNAVCTWAALMVITAGVTECIEPTGYGKFGKETSFTLPPRIGWWCMEIPVTITFLYVFFVKGGSQSQCLVPRICAALMCMHYSYRGWIYPYLIHTHPGAKSNFSLLPAFGGSMVTITHGYLNGKWFAEHGKHLKDRKWLRSPCFIVGIIMYLSGFAAIVYHDNIMRDLRPCPDGQRYCIPRGGLFDYATQAIYFCELWAWFGFALLSCGPNGAFIFLVSFANLVPRSVTSHNWYLSKFGAEYSALDRKYLVPFVW